MRKPNFLCSGVSPTGRLHLCIPVMFGSFIHVGGRARRRLQAVWTAGRCSPSHRLRGRNSSGQSEATQAPFCPRLVLPSGGFFFFCSDPAGRPSTSTTTASASGLTLGWNRSPYFVFSLDGVLKETTATSALQEQTRELYCQNILGLFGRWLERFWVAVIVLRPPPRICRQIKSILSFECFTIHAASL